MEPACILPQVDRNLGAHEPLRMLQGFVSQRVVAGGAEIGGGERETSGS